MSVLAAMEWVSIGNGMVQCPCCHSLGPNHRKGCALHNAISSNVIRHDHVSEDQVPNFVSKKDVCDRVIHDYVSIADDDSNFSTDEDTSFVADTSDTTMDVSLDTCQLPVASMQPTTKGKFVDFMMKSYITRYVLFI